MAVAGIQNFAGMLPMKDASVLPDTASAYCKNAYLYAGTVQGFREAKATYTLQGSDTKQVYRIPLSNAVVPDFISSLWLEFNDPFIAVARAPMVEDTYKRYYFFPSDKALASEGPYYNTLARLQAGQPTYLLGIPSPPIAPAVTAPQPPVLVATLAPTAPPANIVQEVRAYVYTWQSEFDEEGPPSPPTVEQGLASGTAWTIELNPPSSTATGSRTLKYTNIYRSVTALDGTASYYRVAQLPIAQETFLDTAIDASITSNLILPSASWTAPPADLQGVVVMANGILAGFSNTKEIWFCEPYTPHAWPAGYALTVDAPIVALAAVGSSLVVLTESTPWIATGVSPATMTLGKIASREPCISRGSAAPAGEGIYYASPNGLILVNMMGTTNVTQSFITKENWSAMGVEDFSASKYMMAYVAFAKGSKSRDNGVMLDHVTPNVSFSWLSEPATVGNIYSDELSGSTFIVTPTQVLEWNPATAENLLPWVWRSKQYRFPFAQQFVGGIVYFEVPSTLNIAAPTSASRNTSQNQDFNASTQYLLIRAYADNKLVFVREIIENGELFLLPSGFKATYWQFEMEGQVNLKEIKFATSVKELMQL